MMSDRTTPGREPGADEDADDGPLRNLAGSHWEWIAAVISFVLVAAAIVFLIRDATGTPPSPPVIEIRVDSVVAAGSGYLVEFRAHNSSTSTAQALQVEGTLHPSDGAAADVETSQVTLDYLPGRSSRTAGLFFTRDPREGRLEIRPLGYTRP
jgi:uncharacterized protein (TIGR02588 family)